MNDEIKLRTCKEIIPGQDAAGMRPRAGRTATASQDTPGHDPITLPKRTESGQNRRLLGVARWSWPKKPDVVRTCQLGVRALGALACGWVRAGWIQAKNKLNTSLIR